MPRLCPAGAQTHGAVDGAAERAPIHRAVLHRRSVIALLAAAALWPAAARSQARATPFRIALLGSASANDKQSAEELTWLSQGLEAEGLVPRRDFVFDVRYADGDYARFTELTRDLVSRRPGAIVVSTIAAAKAAQGVTTSIPIVMLGLNDPVGSGLVASLGRPGGNITGISTMNEALVLKLFEMVREILPDARRLTALINPRNPSAAGMLAALREAAAAAKVSVGVIEVSAPDALDKALESLAQARPDLLFVIPDVTFAALGPRIPAAAARYGVPVAANFDEIAYSGGLMSYGRVRQDSVHRAARYLKRIADGVAPADLPVEQPTRFRLIINAKVAKQLGVQIPPSLLVRADEVIE
jgi:putative tryptophan/tyrosine transport system substrate-binding protein